MSSCMVGESGAVSWGNKGILEKGCETNGWNLVESRKMDKIITFSLIYLQSANMPRLFVEDVLYKIKESAALSVFTDTFSLLCIISKF